MRSRTGGRIALAMTIALVCPGASARGEDPPRTHNMLVVGQETVFLSHLPMFDAVNDDGNAFTSPHRFQVILEASFTRDRFDVRTVYTADRTAHPGERIYTLNPEDFVLSRLFTPAALPALTSFSATIFRGHLERGGLKIAGLAPAKVTVKRVVHAREFDPKGKKPEKLTYLLFGKGDDAFLAHFIAGPPDFDQVLSVKGVDRDLSDDELSRGLLATVDRENTPTTRVKEGETIAARFSTPADAGGAGQPQAFDLKVRAVREFYFEEGELRVPPTFDQTDEERKSGF